MFLPVLARGLRQTQFKYFLASSQCLAQSATTSPTFHAQRSRDRKYWNHELRKRKACVTIRAQGLVKREEARIEAEEAPPLFRVLFRVVLCLVSMSNV